MLPNALLLLPPAGSFLGRLGGFGPCLLLLYPSRAWSCQGRSWALHEAIASPQAGGQAVPFPPAAAPASPCPRVGSAAFSSSLQLPRAGPSLGEESGEHSPSGLDRGEGAGNVPPLREKGLHERAKGLSPNHFIKLCCMHLFGLPCRKDIGAFNGCSHRHNYR